MDYAGESLKKHYEWRGKLEVKSKASVTSKKELSLAYTPGVAAPCLEIQKDVSKSYELTGRWNTVAVVTDGTAVLGLGDIGPEAGMPVMEGKCVLFKEFGGVNLEDISAPRCFEIESELKKRCDIPIFHDDQHGTAVVTLAALINALKLTGKDISGISAVISGAGAAGIAVTKLLMAVGLRDVVLCDSQGAVYAGRDGLNAVKAEMAGLTNKSLKKGTLAEIIKGADVFIGVSAPDTVTQDMVKSMAKNPILFPMANPVPEIMPELALKAGAAVVGTGRSDFPNQINNVLAFPGIFRGALDVRASDINDDMKIAAAYALAELVDEKKLSADYILPEAFDPRVRNAVASAVAEAARKSGVARLVVRK